MGIPGLYRWLVARYPLTLCDVVEDRSPFVGGPRAQTNTANPNGVEFDNLYIDMNGVIHPCFHPEGVPAPLTYDDVIKSIFRYIDRVFSIVRPRKLLFLAIDGVAPRAKMNHQRIRRFRTAKEAEDEISAIVNVEGINKNETAKKLDSNVITPGTEFMTLLSAALKYYVHSMMTGDAGWRNIKVILSDSSVPGEGEHKIMSYIRSQRNLPGYDPNTRHCLHGLDADLIMLALATHEIHFSILREARQRFISTKQKIKVLKESLDGKGQLGRMRKFIHTLQFEFFNIWVLREYLERELLPSTKETYFDFERLVDDFVLMCLFAGNDFLPHLPQLDIYKGGIELLLIVYKKEFVQMGGYLTNSYKVNLKRVEHFLQALSLHANDMFIKRRQIQNGKGKKRYKSGTQDPVIDNDQPSVAELQSITALKSDDAGSMSDKVEEPARFTKPRYYIEKFDAKTDDDCDRIQRDVVLKYVEGICWVMHCYYQGVCSWQWFYPYHYAPLTSDFCGLDELEVHFNLGQPFKPLDQLLGVLPAASAQALPLCYRELMTNPSSPISDFYPKDAEIDMNGKRHAWQGVCRLPFIDESRLLSEIVKVEHALTDEEKQRNKLGKDILFVGYGHPLAKEIKKHPLSNPDLEVQVKITPRLSGGMNGYICIPDTPVCPKVIESPVEGRSNISKNRIISVYYKHPSVHAHIPKLPHGVVMPPKILRCQDMPPPTDTTPGEARKGDGGTNGGKKSKNICKREKIDDQHQHITSDGLKINEQVKGDDKLDNNGKQKIMGMENEEGTSCKVKRRPKKKWVKRDKVNGASQNRIDAKVGERPTNRMESDLPFAKEQEIKGGEVHLDEGINVKESDKGGGEDQRIIISGEPKQKKRRQAEGDKVEAELELVEGAMKMNGESQSISGEAKKGKRHKIKKKEGGESRIMGVEVVCGKDDDAFVGKKQYLVEGTEEGQNNISVAKRMKSVEVNEMSSGKSMRKRQEKRSKQAEEIMGIEKEDCLPSSPKKKMKLAKADEGI